MNAAILSSTLTCLFLVFLIAGFLYGLWRGFSKSLTRLLIVVAVAVATFFVVPSLSHSLVTADISSWNLSVGDTTVKTIQEFIIEYLSGFDKVNEFMNASPTFTKFIQVLPEVLVNILLFIIFFFVVKMLSMIIYWILSAIFFGKKKTEGKNKHRFIGGIVGAVQGIIIACVILMPVFGLMNLAHTAEVALSESRTELETTIQNSTAGDDNSSPTEFYITQSSESSNDNNTSDENESITVDKALEEVLKYTEALENNFIYKSLNAIGVTKLSNSVFNELTTIKIETASGSHKYSFTTEAVEISKMYPYLELIVNSNFDITDNAFIDKLILLVNKAYDSPLLGDIVTEIIQEAATIWTDTSIDRNQRFFLGIATPDLGSDDLNSVLDEQLITIKNADKETLQSKLVDVLKIAQVANDTMKIAEQVKESIADISVENLESIFDMVTENETVKEVIKDVVTTDTLDSLGITDKSTQTLIVDVVTNIVDSDTLDIKNEVAATKELFTLYEEIEDAKFEERKVELSENEVNNLVENLANSTVITQLIKTKQDDDSASNPIKQLNISENLSNETKSALETAISETEIDQETKNLLEQILLGKTQ